MESGALVEAERQVRSRELVEAAMCVAPASAEPRAGVEILAVGAAVAAASAVAGVGVEASEVGAAVVAAGADVDETGSFFIYLLSLAKEALRRKCRCFEAREILPTSHRSGAGAL